MLERADLLKDLRTHAFALGRAPGPLRIGAEVELIHSASDSSDSSMNSILPAQDSVSLSSSSIGS